MEEAIFKLKDGRSLSYAVYGDSNGAAVFYFHGTPSSRLEPLLINQYGYDLEDLLQKSGIRLIAVDRPGMGFSTYNPQGNYISFADDVRQLAAHLSIGLCPVLCWSGGGPYALALAHRYPELISSVHIICSFTRRFDREVSSQMGMNKWYFWAAKYAPFVLRTSMNILSWKKIRRVVPRKISGLPFEDYRLLNTPAKLDYLAVHTMKQATRLGARGAVHEARNYFNDAGFRLQEIQQPVHYWWGEKDMTVIRLHPEELERKVPNAVMHYRGGEGHLSLYVNCFREVLQVLSQSVRELV